MLSDTVYNPRLTFKHSYILQHHYNKMFMAEYRWKNVGLIAYSTETEMAHFRIQRWQMTGGTGSRHNKKLKREVTTTSSSTQHWLVELLALTIQKDHWNVWRPSGCHVTSFQWHPGRLQLPAARLQQDSSAAILVTSLNMSAWCSFVKV
jgi:hypothetical protein